MSTGPQSVDAAAQLRAMIAELQSGKPAPQAVGSAQAFPKPEVAETVKRPVITPTPDDRPIQAKAEVKRLRMATDQPAPGEAPPPGTYIDIRI